MSKRKSSSAAAWMVLVVLLVVAGAAGYYVRQGWTRQEREPDLPANVQIVVEEMLAAWAGVNALSADVETYVSSALGQPGWTKGVGTYDLMKQDGKLLVRLAINNDLMLDIGDDEDPERYFAGEALRWLVDGDVIYHSFHQPDFKKAGETVARATKEKYAPEKIVQVGGGPLFAQLQRDFELKRLPDIEYEGRQVYVLRGDAHGADWHSLHYFDKESGARVRMVENEADGTASLRIMLKNIDLSPEFEPGHFTFTPPDGVKIEDKMQEGS